MNSLRISLRFSLIRRLAFVLAMMGIVGVLGAFLLGERYANLAYDRALFDDVITLSQEVFVNGGALNVNLPPSAQRWLLNDEGDRVIYRIVDYDSSKVLASNGDLDTAPEGELVSGQAYFRDAVISGVPFRVAYTRYMVDASWPVLVEIGETTSKRRDVARQILVGALLFVALMIATAVVLVWQGISYALAPLAALESEVTRRSAADLAPLDLSLVPTEVRRMVASVNDLMTRLARSIESQKRFVSNAAHQMRTPIAGLHLRAQLLAKQPVSEPVREAIVEIEQEALRAAHLMDQILTLSQLQAQEPVASAVPVDIVEVVTQVIERYLSAAIEAGVDLGYEGPEGPVLVLGNKILFAEMLANLVDNALRYGGSGGVVTIVVSRSAGMVVLEVADAGPGMPESVRAQLFQRFARSDSSPSGGSGLGLSIVKEIAEHYGARASVVSEPGDCRVRIELMAALQLQHPTQ